MSQATLVLLLQQGWQNYQDHVDALTAYKAKYTAALADTALAALATASALPNEQARSATAVKTHGDLLLDTKAYVDMWHLLDGYIEEAWPVPATYRAMRDAAGHAVYDKATHQDWTAMNSLVDAATAFVNSNQTVLEETGEMPGHFAETLRKEGEDLQKLVLKYRREQQAAEQGTSVREVALVDCLATFTAMGRDAQRVFRREPDVARLFEVTYLEGLVGSGGQAGIRGFLTLASGAPAAGVAVEVPGLKLPHTAVSDADGRYEVAVAAGSYTLVLGGSGGYVRQELPVVVSAGVKRRMNAVVEQI